MAWVLTALNKSPPQLDADPTEGENDHSPLTCEVTEQAGLWCTHSTHQAVHLQVTA